jgi:hypothetical protein
LTALCASGVKAMMVNVLRDDLCPFDCHISSSKKLDPKAASRGKFSLLLPISIFLLMGYQSAAQAQDSLGNLGIPTSSERFFEAGTERFEREIQNLQERSRATENILHIHADVQTPEDLLRLEDPRIHLQDPCSRSEVKLLNGSTQIPLIVHPLSQN